MDKILRALYDSFYTLPEMTELKETVEDRKVVLRIVDDMSMMALERSYDSFICGFKLAWRLANELNNYKENERSTPAGDAGLDARFVSEEGEPI